MKLTTLDEFQTMTGLPDTAILWLLRQQPQLWSLDNGRLEIDIEAVELEALVTAMAAKEGAELKDRERLIAERFARIITNHLDSILTDVFGELSSQAGRRIGPS